MSNRCGNGHSLVYLELLSLGCLGIAAAAGIHRRLERSQCLALQWRWAEWPRVTNSRMRPYSHLAAVDLGDSRRWSAAAAAVVVVGLDADAEADVVGVDVAPY